MSENLNPREATQSDPALPKVCAAFVVWQLQGTEYGETGKTSKSEKAAAGEDAHQMTVVHSTCCVDLVTEAEAMALTLSCG